VGCKSMSNHQGSLRRGKAEGSPDPDKGRQGKDLRCEVREVLRRRVKGLDSVSGELSVNRTVNWARQEKKKEPGGEVCRVSNSRLGPCFHEHPEWVLD